MISNVFVMNVKNQTVFQKPSLSPCPMALSLRIRAQQVVLKVAHTGILVRGLLATPTESG